MSDKIPHIEPGQLWMCVHEGPYKGTLMVVLTEINNHGFARVDYGGAQTNWCPGAPLTSDKFEDWWKLIGRVPV